VSDTAIDSIHLVVQFEKIIVVSDGLLYFVDTNLVQPVRRLSSLKGVRVVSRRFRSGESEFSDLVGGDGGASSSGKRFLLKLGGGIRSNGVKSKELELGRDGNCVFAAIVGKKLMIIALDLNDSTTGSVVILKEIQCVDGVKTMVWVDNSLFVGTSTGYYLYSCVTGTNALIFSLPDPTSSPLLKLFVKDFKVLLLVDNVGVTVNAQGQPVGGSFVFRHSPDSVGELTTFVVAIKNGKMELYHKKSGDFIQVIAFAGEGLGQFAVADDENSTGKLIAVGTPSKIVCYRKVSAEEQIKYLLRKKNFEEAVSLVEEFQNEGELTNEMLSFVHAQVGFLLLFDLHFEEAVNHFLMSETMEPSEVFPFIMRDPNRWSLLVPRNRYWGLHPPPVPLENVIDDGLMAIQRAIFLKKAGVESILDNDFLLNPPTRSDLLDSAINNIIRYLQASREKDLTVSVREGVDTLLMYLYRALNRADEMEKLASSENSCVVDELESLLGESGHLRTLAFLYASKGISSKALHIWKTLARNYSSGYWKDSSNSDDSLDAKEIAAIEASKILEEESDQDLVLQHLGWVADINQVLAVQVLTSEKRTDQLSPDAVIAAIDPKKVEILQRYLQWLIEDQDCDDTQFHTSYALLLAKSASETYEAQSRSPNSDTETNSSKPNNSIFQSPVRDRLQIFLQSSDLYDPEEVLDMIEGSELWLEKVNILTLYQI
jgi:hypothetical protein